MSEPIYFVTDIEADGPNPGHHSMLAFASVATRASGESLATFAAVLAPLEDCAPDPGTLAWFQSQPEAWAAATHDPKPAALVMMDFTQWVRSFPKPRIFAAHGLAFDGGWIDHYLVRFTNERLIESLRHPDPLFAGGGLCLRSMAAGALGWPLQACQFNTYPPELLGHIAHTHEALADALGFAHLLRALHGAQRRNQPPPP